MKKTEGQLVDGKITTANGLLYRHGRLTTH